MNLAAIDLKLLVVFDALIAERSVTRAGDRLGMSQPAVSNALNRLRDLVNDRLFLRTGEGMSPTPRALDLAGPVQAALRQLEAALEPAVFEPHDVDWTFHLEVSDHASVVMLPFLIEHVAKVAPSVKLKIQSKGDIEVSTLLDSNKVDIAIGVMPDLPKRFVRVPLFEDKYVCMMRRGHPLAGRPLSLDDFMSVDHLSIKPGSHDVSRADRFLQHAGVRRRTVTTVHQFLAAPAVIARSDLVVLVYERMTRIFDPREFYFCPVPVKGMNVDVSAVWSRATAGHPANKWMRRQIAIACRPLLEPAADSVEGRDGN